MSSLAIALASRLAAGAADAGRLADWDADAAGEAATADWEAEAAGEAATVGWDVEAADPQPVIRMTVVARARTLPTIVWLEADTLDTNKTPQGAVNTQSCRGHKSSTNAIVSTSILRRSTLQQAS
jgi:hypothetical protein